MATKDHDSWLDKFFTGAKEAVKEAFDGSLTDIRHKVVEEPWFGRETSSDAPYTPSEPQKEADAPNEQQQEIVSPYHVLYGMPETFAEYTAQREGKQVELSPVLVLEHSNEQERE
jgi:hypothetical protein